MCSTSMINAEKSYPIAINVSLSLSSSAKVITILSVISELVRNRGKYRFQLQGNLRRISEWISKDNGEIERYIHRGCSSA